MTCMWSSSSRKSSSKSSRVASYSLQHGRLESFKMGRKSEIFVSNGRGRFGYSCMLFLGLVYPEACRVP